MGAIWVPEVVGALQVPGELGSLPAPVLVLTHPVREKVACPAPELVGALLDSGEVAQLPAPEGVVEKPLDPEGVRVLYPLKGLWAPRWVVKFVCFSCRKR